MQKSELEKSVYRSLYTYPLPLVTQQKEHRETSGRECSCDMCVMFSWFIVHVAQHIDQHYRLAKNQLLRNSSSIFPSKSYNFIENYTHAIYQYTDTNKVSREERQHMRWKDREKIMSCHGEERETMTTLHLLDLYVFVQDYLKKKLFPFKSSMVTQQLALSV